MRPRIEDLEAEVQHLRASLCRTEAALAEARSQQAKDEETIRFLQSLLRRQATRTSPPAGSRKPMKH